MYGKLTLGQNKALQTLLIQSGQIALETRSIFLANAGLGAYLRELPMGAVEKVFAGALVQKVEQLGAPPALDRRFATVLLVEALLGEDSVNGNSDSVAMLKAIIAVYEPDSINITPKNPSLISRPRSKELRILFLAANPSDTGKLRLQEEYEIVKKTWEDLRVDNPTLNVVFEFRDKVRDADIDAYLLKVRPHIVHFSGHGDLVRPNTNTTLGSSSFKWRGMFLVNEDDRTIENMADEAKPSGIVLEKADGHARLIPPEDFARYFAIRAINQNVRLVILNACWADGQATALKEKAAVPFVIGMKQQILDVAALYFAEGFYRALFSGTSMRDALQFGQAKVGMMAPKGQFSIPSLHTLATKDDSEVLMDDPILKIVP